MIIKSIPNQIRLSENGDISWQKDPTNPLPGEKIGAIIKGDALITPKVQIEETELVKAEGLEAVQDKVQVWLNEHVQAGLEPMFKLLEDDITAPAAKQIAQKIFDSVGILPREDVQDLIDQMDEEARQSLRSKKIRFGPLLVYLPELKKPAAVRMQAMLLSVWNGKTLPAEVPSDGIVSFSIEGKEGLDKDYLLAIGYPVYGARACRVDMLDRVVCAVYDNAKEGKFQAQHQMAEWLGSNIADLYGILEAMGHKKIHDPADQVVEEPKDAAPLEETPKVDSAEEKPKDTNQEKPELATFALKRGKASQSAQANNQARSDKKPFKKKEGGKPKKSFKNKPQNKSKGKSEPRERVYKAEAKTNPADSPFAILEQLKTSGKKD